MTHSIERLAIKPICSTAAALTWDFPGEPVSGFEIERQQLFDDDQSWRRVATLPATARRYESVGLLNAPGRSWRHRVRAIGQTGDTGPWSELPPIELPQNSHAPQGTVIRSASAEAPRNIHASLLKRRDGRIIAAYTASSGMHDYCKSWIALMAQTPAGEWEDLGALFPSRPEWPVVSRESLVRLPDGRIAATYSLGKPKPNTDSDWHTSAFIHRTVFRISDDDGQSWSDERLISDDLYDYELANSNGTRNVVLSNGRLFTSISVCRPPSLRKLAEQWWDDPHVNEIMGTYLLYSDDSGRTWQRYPREKDRFFFVGPGPFRLTLAAGMHETTIVEHAPGKLLMLGRTVTGYLYECRSDDFGATWTEPARTDIMQSPSPPNLTRIPGTSTIVLIYNPLDIPRHQPDLNWEISRRQILATQLSDDGGRTWYGYREVEYAPHEPSRLGYMYPDFLWDGDDLHVIYARFVDDLYYRRLTKNWLLGKE